MPLCTWNAAAAMTNEVATTQQRKSQVNRANVLLVQMLL
jgi:hypothetical protein